VKRSDVGWKDREAKEEGEEMGRQSSCQIQTEIIF
jgi:hypothetical protein